MKPNIKIVTCNHINKETLEEFIYQAIYIPDGEQLPDRNVIYDPEIYVYVKDFGCQPGDHAVIAYDNELPVGIAWTRIIPAYGHIDESTPELAISMLPEYRGQGIGTFLMYELFKLLRQKGYTRTSLSVQKDNPAVSFYKRLGYVITEEKKDHIGQEDYIMIKELTNSESLFSGKAKNYLLSRPAYAKEAIQYITSLISPDSVIADIGAGTGAFTIALLERGYQVIAVEPNADMRELLVEELASYPNADICDGGAESTKLENQSVDVIAVAQALHWFDLVKFKKECERIGKPGCKIFIVYNSPREDHTTFRTSAVSDFFKVPIIKEFENPISFTEDKWMLYMTSHSHDPTPGDENYEDHLKYAKKIFDQENIDGILYRDMITTVYTGEQE